MKKRLVFCLVICVMLSGSIFTVPGGNVMAQVSREIPTPTPDIVMDDIVKGPAKGILELKIRDGLKRVLLVDLFATHGDYEKALEIVDYTKPVTVLDRELAIAEDPELIRLLEYQRQKIEGMKRALPTPVPTLIETVKSRADAEYQNILYLKKHKKPAEAIQTARNALELYQQIENIEGQLLVHYQLAFLYKKVGNTTEALRQAQEFMKLEQQLKLVKKVEEIQELLKELGKETTTD